MSTTKLKQPSISGRVGTGIGKGLAEQIPKEIDRYRLSSGLNQFSQNAANQSPMQNMAQLMSIPGITPQMIQTMGELAQRNAQAGALSQGSAQQGQPQPPASPFAGMAPMAQEQQSAGYPSITKEKNLEEIQKGYIPPTEPEYFEGLRRTYEARPAFWGYDVQNAKKYYDESLQREKQRVEAHAGQHGTLTALQDKVVSKLKSDSERRGATGKYAIPDKIYSTIENQAIDAVRPKGEEGGKGMTEQAAAKEGADKVERVSNAQETISKIGDWRLPFKNPAETKRSLKEVQKVYDEFDDTKGMAETLMAKNGLSPWKAYSIAQPISNVPAANNFLKELKKLPGNETIGLGTYRKTKETSADETKKIAPKLAKMMKENEKLSPLAIAHELEKKNYDPEVWLSYLTENKDKYDLRQRQIDQLQVTRPLITPLNDWWLEAFGGE